MIKLYKSHGAETRYWEAWDAGKGCVVVHWGLLGTRGDAREVTVPRNVSAAEVIESESIAPSSEGFCELELEDHAQLIIQFRTEDAWGDSEDLDRRHLVEELLNECLGWTGNGHCDGGDIGSGTINAYAFVVEPFLARDAIVAGLNRERLLDGAIIAIDREGEYEVIWPDGFSGDFQIFYE